MPEKITIDELFQAIESLYDATIKHAETNDQQTKDALDRAWERIYKAQQALAKQSSAKEEL